MHLQERIQLLVDLGQYMTSDDPDWTAARQKAFAENGWFTPAFIDLAVKNIVTAFLDKKKLNSWAKQYALPEENASPKNIGLIMAGNIPLVGFHDFLSVFITGHRQTIKTSSKDHTLIHQLAGHLYATNENTRNYISFDDMLKGRDAYIATGSNHSARYFDYYFAKYPHIIRRNRTSVAILNGRETRDRLDKLADDVFFYFGLGCRNVTKLYVPEGYDFIPLLEAFRKYDDFARHNKYKNNYDYQLTILILNKRYYMSNDCILLEENQSPFSPISVLHYEYYKEAAVVSESAAGNEDIQCILGTGFLPFGESQAPGLTDYADGVDTLQFLRDL